MALNLSAACYAARHAVDFFNSVWAGLSNELVVGVPQGRDVSAAQCRFYRRRHAKWAIINEYEMFRRLVLGFFMVGVWSVHVLPETSQCIAARVVGARHARPPPRPHAAMI